MVFDAYKSRLVALSLILNQLQSPLRIVSDMSQHFSTQFAPTQLVTCQPAESQQPVGVSPSQHQMWRRGPNLFPLDNKAAIVSE